MFGDQGAPTTPGLTQSSKLRNNVQQKEKESPNGKNRGSRDMHKKVSEMKKSLTGSLAQQSTLQKQPRTRASRDPNVISQKNIVQYQPPVVLL